MRLRGATTGYPGFKLGPVTLEARPGEVLALIGPNASGKTTLLRLLAGILPLHQGEAEACGHKAAQGRRLPGERLATYAPAVPQLDPWARVHEVLEAAGTRDPPDWIQDILDRRVGELSSGQRKLVDLARALSQRRPLLLVDEPLAFLDVKHQALAIREIRRHAENGGIAVIAVHELHLTPLIADKIAVISQGKLVAQGTPDDILDPAILEPIYQTRLQSIKTPQGKIILLKP